jgi:putative ABC transport system permease protein
MLDLNPLVVLAASFSLVAVSIGISVYLKLGFERPILIASVRATVQLAIVGFLLGLLLESQWEEAIAAIWIVAMVIIAAFVTGRRAGTRAIVPAAGAAIGAATAISLAIVFGFGVLPPEPIQLVVIAGITIGNALAGTVVAADQVKAQIMDKRLQIEGLLSLGLDAKQSARFIVREATRVALLPQIERTKVVGLVALPGAMAGLLIAGVAPKDAVVIQLVVMFLVLGTLAVSATVVALVTARSSFTPDQRLEPTIFS